MTKKFPVTQQRLSHLIQVATQMLELPTSRARAHLRDEYGITDADTLPPDQVAEVLNSLVDASYESVGSPDFMLAEVLGDSMANAALESDMANATAVENASEDESYLAPLEKALKRLALLRQIQAWVETGATITLRRRNVLKVGYLEHVANPPTASHSA